MSKKWFSQLVHILDTESWAPREIKNSCGIMASHVLESCIAVGYNSPTTQDYALEVLQ
jgi:hypothetical protein